MHETPRSVSGEIDELVFAALEGLEREGQTGLEAICQAHPQAASEIRRRVGALAGAGLIEPEHMHGRPVLQRLGEFRIEEELGQGGMGIVYRAVQEGLGRQVALKVVRPEHLYFPGARARFRREVETVAKLQHPGIVAVHSVGEENGVPYFAMELVRGKSIDEVLKSLRGRAPTELRGQDLDPAPGSGGYLFAGTWEQACLRVLRQVCEALEFAHQNGVLHRDIKPSNVMLTSEGLSRALLLDFGLAIGRGSAKLTRSNAQVGSLRYMAIESLRANQSEIGPHTDVYGLGVTLYEMLTLSPAFQGGSDVEIMRSIESGALPSVRSKNPEISWEAQTICATAMDPDPKRRYQSAADLGRDLANALEHRPIDARRASLWLRTKRWSQRKPAAATALTLGALALVILPLAYAWQQRQSARQITVQRDRAQAAYAGAMEAIDTMVSRVGEVDLRFVPAMEPLQRRLLEDAVALVERVVQTAGADGSVSGRTELARAHTRLGKLLIGLGRHSEAVKTLESASSLWPAVFPADTDDFSLRVEVAHSRLKLTEALGMAGDLERASRELADLTAQLDASQPQMQAHIPLQWVRVEARTALGKFLDLQGKIPEARELLLSAAEESDRVLAQDQNKLSAMRTAVGVWTEYGQFLSSRLTEKGERNEAAETALERCLQLARLVAAHPQAEPSDRDGLAKSLVNRGGVPLRAGDFLAARDLYLESRQVAEALFSEFPNTPTYRLGLATAVNQLGLVHDNLKEYGPAGEFYEETVEHLTKVCEAAPNEPTFQARLSTALFNLAFVERLSGNYPDFDILLLRAREHIRRARELAPDNRDFQASHFAVLKAGCFNHAPLDHASAATWAARITQELPIDGRAHHSAGLAYVRCFEKAHSDANLTGPPREQLLASYAARACAMYRKAVELGAPYQDAEALQALKDPAPIHGSAAWKELVAWLEARPK